MCVFILETWNKQQLFKYVIPKYQTQIDLPKLTLKLYFRSQLIIITTNMLITHQE